MQTYQNTFTENNNPETTAKCILVMLCIALSTVLLNSNPEYLSPTFVHVASAAGFAYSLTLALQEVIFKTTSLVAILFSIITTAFTFGIFLYQTNDLFIKMPVIYFEGEYYIGAPITVAVSIFVAYRIIRDEYKDMKQNLANK